MDFMNVKDDIKQILLERLKSPIINFYLFFLVLYNWDLILMLFFLNGDVNSKILELKSTYENKKIIWILNWRFIAPIIYAFLSIVLFPFVSNFIDDLLKPITKKRIKNFYEIEELKADKDLIVINKRTGNKTLEDLQIQISKLNNNLESERGNFQKLNDNFTKLNSDYIDLQQANSRLSSELKNKETDYHLNSLKNKMLEENDYFMDSNLSEVEKSMLRIIFADLKVSAKNVNGDFNFINFIINQLNNIEYFTSKNLIETILEGFKNLYFESSSKDVQILFYEDFTIRNDVNAQLIYNSNKLADYMLEHKITRLDRDQSIKRNEKVYKLK